MANGWTGNILRVNLTTGNITLEDSSKFKSFVGGMGLSLIHISEPTRH